MDNSPSTPSRGVYSPSSEGRVSLKELGLVFGKVGAIGFGGGVGMLALIRQEVVERRKWISDDQLATAVAMGQMLPGPFVSNYAEFIGYELRGLLGMVVAVVALLFPCFLLMCLLSFLYFRYGGVPLVARLFAGVQPVVVGVLAWATLSIGRVNIRTWRAIVISLVAAVALALKGDVLLVILGCGVLGIVFSGAWRKAKGNRLAGLIPCLMFAATSAGSAFPELLLRAGELALVFLKMGTVIFGGGFAAIPFLQHEVVEVRHWLTTREFIDGVALGQITPGPVAITAAFIGYKVLGLAGAVIAMLGTFLPSSLMLLGLIHIYRQVAEQPLVRGFLSGVLPAVTGLLLSATIFVGRSALVGPAQAIVALLSLALLLRFRIDPVWLLLGGAALGLVLH